MLRTVFRLGLVAGLVGGAAAALSRLLGRREGPPAPVERATWPPLSDVAVAPGPDPSPVRLPGADQTSAATTTGVEGGAWVAPEGGACPASHPVKAKLATKIFHVPGGQSYLRTSPDRCYRDGTAAEADGFRQAKR
ncbi:hypothetical protein BH18ACT1_BH18ACT1_15440 [soil metagenome]